MQPTIREYRPAWASDFDRLNRAWLEEFFTVEPVDEWVLTNPDEALLRPGGRILCAVTPTEEVVGVVALRPAEPGMLEMTKMAVDKAWQNHGIGQQLVEAAIAAARALDAATLMLYSSTRLAPAIRLYRRLGFQEVPLPSSPYARSDIRMELPL